jgi:branched-chain amino acid aminotransferase
MGELFDIGINAVITSQRAIPAHLLDPKVKNRSRIHYNMANIEASQVAGKNNWALLLDPDGLIAEGTGTNFFIVRKGEILTPEGRNILRGISRAYIFELAEELGVSCRESNLETYDVYAADEAFMTGTPFCMLPVTSLNGTAIGDGKVGPVFTKLLSVWSKNMEVDIKGQIQKWNSISGLQVEGTPTPYQFKK